VAASGSRWPAQRRAGGRGRLRPAPPPRCPSIGYDYLADETGVQLEPIPADRRYHPPHIDDGGLWMFDLSDKAGGLPAGA
jgi:hypothetical protein